MIIYLSSFIFLAHYPNILKKIKNLSLIAAAAAGAGMGACAVSAAILYKKTIPRPKGVDMAIVDEFADKEKFEEYMEKGMLYIQHWEEDTFAYS